MAPFIRRDKPRLYPALLTMLLLPCALGETITYTITPEPDASASAITIEWPTGGSRTASFLHISTSAGAVENLVELLKDVQFEGAQSVEERDGLWRVQHRPQARLRIFYRVKPRQRNLDWKKTQLPVTNNHFFHGLGKTFLLAPQAGGGMPEQYDFVVRWKLPDDWQAACSWGGVGATVGARLHPADFRDSVYFAGRLHVARSGTKQLARSGAVTVAMVDEFRFSAERLLEVAQQIIAAQCDFLRETNFPDFLITVVPVGDPIRSGEARLSGTGLYHSFALWVAPESQLNDAVENLFAHELFHFWNGRLLHAREPEKEHYWFIEGLTDYYAMRILLESGYWKPATYAKWVNRQLLEYQKNPEKNAFNARIAQEFWQARSTVGEVPYQRGSALGLRWHRLAQDQGVKLGIDRWFFALLHSARENPRFDYDNNELKRIGVRELGRWFEAEFERFVEQADTVNVPATALAPDFTGRTRAVYEYEPGFDPQRSVTERKIVGLKKSSEAAKAGLREGDAMLALRIRSDPDEQAVVTIERNGRRREIRFYPRGARTDVLQFVPAK